MHKKNSFICKQTLEIWALAPLCTWPAQQAEAIQFSGEKAPKGETLQVALTHAMSMCSEMAQTSRFSSGLVVSQRVYA